MKSLGILRSFLVLCFLSCSTDDTKPEQRDDTTAADIESKAAVEGIRIAWDFTTRTLISQENDTGYHGYARLIQLQDKSLLVVYESDGDVVVKKSSDQGDTWSGPIRVVRGNQGVHMATPDVLQLLNGAILVMYNPRPGETAPTEKFQIKTILSYDGGRSWEYDQVVYEGATEFENGVWEPTALQLPDGEIQLFFSNENTYRNSSEQNISLLRSTDHGLNWTQEPEIASFREGSRDGMPSLLYLQDQREILVAIEDNGIYNQFKPYLIINSVSDNWRQTVDGSSDKRRYALKEPLEESEYAGAPYLAQLRTGETLLSYQGTDHRSGNDLNNADMKVAIGNESGEDFNRISTPFIIPEGKSALWNSIAVLEDNSIIALATTNAFSPANASEVWMIRGRVIPELEAENASLAIDGEASENIWLQPFPVFIGHRGTTQLTAHTAADEQHLYVVVRISGATHSQDGDTRDAVVLYVDPLKQNLVAPGPGIFKINLSSANEVRTYQGMDAGWTELKMVTIRTAVNHTTEGYTLEISIPWNSMGGKPASNSSIGFNMELIQRGTANYTEVISATEADAPYTWLALKI